MSRARKIMKLEVCPFDMMELRQVSTKYHEMTGLLGHGKPWQPFEIGRFCQ